MRIGHKIKRRRIELGMSQDELANILGYSTRSTISRIESGDHDPPVSKIPDFAAALQVPQAYFLNPEMETFPYFDDTAIIRTALSICRAFQTVRFTDREIDDIVDYVTYIANKRRDYDGY